MSEFTIFYSWQSDTPRKVGRDFIKLALEAAVARINAARGGVCTMRIDSDTQGEPGTPPITDTILRKIRECDVFVGEVSFVAQTPAGKASPNPNVMGEYGFALSEKGTRRILLVMNIAYGLPENLPFDLRHLRHPARFNAPEAASDRERRAEREKLSAVLERNLLAVMEHAEKEGEEDAGGAGDHAALYRLQELLNVSGGPVLVMPPKAVVHVVPVRGREIAPDLKAVKSVRPYFAPQGSSDIVEGVDAREWWTASPPLPIEGKPNPAAKWCTRLFRDGSLEYSLHLGARIGDDSEILVDGVALEAALLGALESLVTVSSKLGYGKSFVVSLALFGVEDVVFNHSVARSRRLRTQTLYLGRVLNFTTDAGMSAQLKPLFDQMWLAAGVDDGSPSYNDAGEWCGLGG